MLPTFPQHGRLDAPWDHIPAGAIARWDACREPLLSWFAAHARDLPWRAPYAGTPQRVASRDPRLPLPPRRAPYAVWIAEIMLQQTVVAAVIPHFQRWMRTFPDVRALAEAPPEQVLQAWAGLGYYARARNLHKGAKMVAEGGVWPLEASAWREVAGVGEYTAGAVASLAFGRRAPLLDGNVVRVFSRLQGLNFLPGAGAREKRLYWDLARLWVGAGDDDVPGGPDEAVFADPGALNEALMELGALVCVPATPRCDVCPLERFCAARAQGGTNVLPPAKPRPPITRVKAVAVVAVVSSAASVLMETRPRGAFLAGHLMFPLFLGDDAADWRGAFLRRHPGWCFEDREDRDREGRDPERREGHEHTLRKHRQRPAGSGDPRPGSLPAALHHTIMRTRYDVEVYRAALRPATPASRFPPPDQAAPVLTAVPRDEVGGILSNALARKIWKAGGGRS